MRITASVLGAPSEEQRNSDLAGLLAWGLAQYHPVKAVSSRRVYGLAETGYGRAPVKLVAPRDVVRPVRVGTPLVERVVVSTGARAARQHAASASARCASTPAGGWSRARRSSTATSVSSSARRARSRWYARRTVHHLVGLVT